MEGLEVLFQFEGHHERPPQLFVYSSPVEKSSYRSGVIPSGGYFICSSIVYYGDNCWMKIRRGPFSKAILTGYVRVTLDDSADASPDSSIEREVPTKYRSAAALCHTPSAFKYLRRIPKFPSYCMAHERIEVHKKPTFTAPATSSYDTSLPSRHVPAHSVFHTSECLLDREYATIALHISSPTGVKGWIHLPQKSFYSVISQIEDPKYTIRSNFLVQNIASPIGNWAGDLPIRSSPDLQATKRSWTLPRHALVYCHERKLVHDQVWLRVSKPTMFEPEYVVMEEQREEHWVVERNAQTGRRVVIPFGGLSIKDSAQHLTMTSELDDQHRLYRNVYGRKPLPLRASCSINANVTGYLNPGGVYLSHARYLDKDKMWIAFEVDGRTGYSLQMNAKTNACLLQEVPPASKMHPSGYFQIQKSDQPDSTNGMALEQEEQTRLEQSVAVFTDASFASEEIFRITRGSVVKAVGLCHSEESMWLQVLASDVDSSVKVASSTSALDTVSPSLPASASNVVHIPLYHASDTLKKEVGGWNVRRFNRRLEKVEDPTSKDSKSRSSTARVVFSGRASKLFGDHFLRDSTASTRSSGYEMRELDTSRVGVTRSDAQNLREGLVTPQLEGGIVQRMRGAGQYLLSCVERSATACMERPGARDQYAQVFQEDDVDAEYGEPTQPFTRT